MDRYIYGNRTYLLTENDIGGIMKMTFKTKMRKNAGSMITVIPSGLVNLLKVQQGDKLIWDADITEKGVNITIKTEKQEST